MEQVRHTAVLGLELTSLPLGELQWGREAVLVLQAVLDAGAPCWVLVHSIALVLGAGVQHRLLVCGIAHGAWNCTQCWCNMLGAGERYCTRFWMMIMMPGHSTG